MYSQQFVKDQEVWKKTRPEFAKLVQGIKNDESAEALASLADDAGCSANEIADFRYLYRRASRPDVGKRAAKFGKLKIEVATLNEKIGEVDRAMSLAKTSLERDEFEGELYNLVETRQRLNLAFADASVAAACVDAAKEAGVL